MKSELCAVSDCLLLITMGIKKQLFFKASVKLGSVK